MEWSGHYLDGKTTARHRSTIRLLPGGLEIRTDDGLDAFWPYPEIQQASGRYANEPVRLERRSGSAEAVVVTDSAFLAQLATVASQLGSDIRVPERRAGRIARWSAGAAAALALIATLYLWGIPVLADGVASHVPASWEERLGSAAMEGLLPPGKRCAESDGTRALDDVLAVLAKAVPSSPYTFRVSVLDEPIPNALAAPGGYIVVTRGLLDLIRAPEELAGVLAHEMEHILLRHGTRSLLRQASLDLGVALLAGDPGGSPGIAAETARTLGLLRYSRQQEDEADTEGLRLLVAAEVDPGGMVTILERLDAAEAQGKAPGYLSTHPALAHRAERLGALLPSSAATAAVPLRVDGWTRIGSICQTIV